MILTGENRNTKEKTSSSDTLSTTNPSNLRLYMPVYVQWDFWERGKTVRRTGTFIDEGTWDEYYNVITREK
jgi:hypothetical protein